jgi:hypothetical protein
VSGDQQVPERFEGGFADTLITVIAGTPKPTTLAAAAQLKNEEPLEIKTKF